MRVPPRRFGSLKSRRGFGAIAAGAVGSLVLAACSSPSPPATTTTTTSATTTTTTTTTSTPPTSSTSAAVAECAVGALRLAEDVAKSAQGAGSEDVAFTLTNSGSTPCTLDGYPKVTLFSGEAGAKGKLKTLTIAATHSGPAPARVNLKVGGVGAFYLVESDVPVDGVGCSSASSISVIPPGGSAPLLVVSSLAPCGPSVGITAIVPLRSLST